MRAVCLTFGRVRLTGERCWSSLSSGVSLMTSAVLERLVLSRVWDDFRGLLLRGRRDVLRSRGGRLLTDLRSYALESCHVNWLLPGERDLPCGGTCLFSG